MPCAAGLTAGRYQLAELLEDAGEWVTLAALSAAAKIVMIPTAGPGFEADHIKEMIGGDARHKLNVAICRVLALQAG
jgi:hypothetical protein